MARRAKTSLENRLCEGTCVPHMPKLVNNSFLQATVRWTTRTIFYNRCAKYTKPKCKNWSKSSYRKETSAVASGLCKYLKGSLIQDIEKNYSMTVYFEMPHCATGLFPSQPVLHCHCIWQTCETFRANMNSLESDRIRRQINLANITVCTIVFRIDRLFNCSLRTCCRLAL